MVKDDAEMVALKQELNDLIASIKAEQEKQADCKLAETCADMADVPKLKMSTKKSLKGHINKVNSVHFASDSRYGFSLENDWKLCNKRKKKNLC